LGKEESAETSGETEVGSETSEETIAEAKEQLTLEGNATPEVAEQPAEGKKEDVEKLRTVIKVNEEESPSPTEGEKEETPKPTILKVPKVPQAPATSADGSREDLEHRRNMLQSIKDFDFQIKKNQEDIGKMVEKLDGLTKDLDDLVSLYEIVTEQMNPFVGLSKVTKKRIDALENFTQEIEDIKIRMEDVESSVEKGVGGIKRLTKKLDTKGPAPDSSEIVEKPELELEKQDMTIDDISSEIAGRQETQLEETEVTTEVAANETSAELVIETPNVEIEDKKSDVVVEPEVQIAEPVSIPSTSEELHLMNGDVSDDDLDIILNKSLESLLAEQNVDYMINEFLLSLK